MALMFGWVHEAHKVDGAASKQKAWHPQGERILVPLSAQAVNL